MWALAEIKRQNAKPRKAEAWETSGYWLWTIHRGVWHVVTTYAYDPEHHTHLAALLCRLGGTGLVDPMGTTQDTGFHLRNTTDRRFCRVCREWLNGLAAKERAEGAR